MGPLMCLRTLTLLENSCKIEYIQQTYKQRPQLDKTHQMDRRSAINPVGLAENRMVSECKYEPAPVTRTTQGRARK